MSRKSIDFGHIDTQIIAFFNRTFIPLARGALFLVFFWFGILKVFKLSPASPLAKALTEKTIGLQYFDSVFSILAILECVIGILFLFPKLTRVVVPLLLVHMLVVCSPLLLVPEYTWQSFLVPSLEGQYIIKNAVVVALAIGIAASTKSRASRRSS